MFIPYIDSVILSTLYRKGICKTEEICQEVEEEVCTEVTEESCVEVLETKCESVLQDSCSTITTKDCTTEMVEDCSNANTSHQYTNRRKGKTFDFLLKPIKNIINAKFKIFGSKSSPKTRVEPAEPSCKWVRKESCVDKPVEDCKPKTTNICTEVNSNHMTLFHTFFLSRRLR